MLFLGEYNIEFYLLLLEIIVIEWKIKINNSNKVVGNNSENKFWIEIFFFVVSSDIEIWLLCLYQCISLFLNNCCVILLVAFVLFLSRRGRSSLSTLVCLSGALLCFLWSWPAFVKDSCTGFRCMRWGGWGVGMVWGFWWGLGSPGRAYLNRFSLAPSSHCGRWKLILCKGTLEPWMHGCVAHTKVMEILLLKCPHVHE